MLLLENIKALNIEVSSQCIGNCPFCSRNQKIRPYDKYQISTNEFKLLPISLIKQLKENKYCTIKCNKYKNLIRAELVLYDKFFMRNSG
jgi:hypothetical protein